MSVLVFPSTRNLKMHRMRLQSGLATDSAREANGAPLVGCEGDIPHHQHPSTSLASRFQRIRRPMSSPCQLMLTNRAMRLEVSQGHQTWYHLTSTHLSIFWILCTGRKLAITSSVRYLLEAVPVAAELDVHWTRDLCSNLFELIHPVNIASIAGNASVEI